MILARKPKAEPAQELEAEKLRLELASLRWEHRAQRASIAWKGLLTLGGLLLLIGVAVMIVNAATSRGIVIERFETPPGFLEGLSDEERTELLLHRLSWLRANTRSTEWDFSRVGAPRADWLDDVRIEIPTTGIALGDLHRAVRRWLGHDAYVRVRLAVAPPRVVSSSPADPVSPNPPCLFHALAWQAGDAREPICVSSESESIYRAAEAVYRQVHPYLYAIYLSGVQGRTDDANELLLKLAFEGEDLTERTGALNALAANLLEIEGRCEAALSLVERAAGLRSSFANAWANVSNARTCLGDNQGAATATMREISALRSSRHELSQSEARRRLAEASILLAEQLGDHEAQLLLARDMEQHGLGVNAYAQAHSLAELHDIGAAYRYLTPENATPLSETERMRLRYRINWEFEDWQAAAESLGRLNQIYEEAHRFSDVRVYLRRQALTQHEPLRAIALARAGRVDEAEAIVRTFPSGCYLCARGRALVAEMSGERSEADRWLAEAVRLGPRLPSAYLERGQIQLARGEDVAALDSFSEALRHGPRWADAMKLRGDALAQLGDLEGALRDYQAAAALAPHWLELKTNLAMTLWRIGRRPEAQARFSEAARLAGSTHDRQRLRRVLEQLSLLN